MKNAKKYLKILLITLICLIAINCFGTINSYADDELNITNIFDKGDKFINAR